MANFPPLKRYMFFCLEKIIHDYSLRPPFLDAGCGRGDVSCFLASRGWHGTAIDFSPDAINEAKKTLARMPAVHVAQRDIMNEVGTYNTIILWDCLEHIEDDARVLQKLAALLAPEGVLLVSVPSNPREWRWDDVFYGHFRRYAKDAITEKLKTAQLKPVLFWDITFPFFWFLRRVAVRLKSSGTGEKESADARTKKSSLAGFWSVRTDISFFNTFLFLWTGIYWIQFLFFRHCIDWGHEMFIVVKKD